MKGLSDEFMQLLEQLAQLHMAELAMRDIKSEGERSGSKGVFAT